MYIRERDTDLLLVSRARGVLSYSHFLVVMSLLPDGDGGAGEVVDEQGGCSTLTVLVKLDHHPALLHADLTQDATILRDRGEEEAEEMSDL